MILNLPYRFSVCIELKTNEDERNVVFGTFFSFLRDFFRFIAILRILWISSDFWIFRLEKNRSFSRKNEEFFLFHLCFFIKIMSAF